jgi:acetylornithine deacetylase/succinyl-diaminopimelate desuccinylase-like protein
MPGTSDQVSAVYRGTTSLRAVLLQRDTLTLRDQVAITEIAAPTGEEDERGQMILTRFEAAGLENIRVDGAGNVVARRPGVRDIPPVVLCAHMDTVFPRETKLVVRAEGSRLSAPGIGDNARGLAAMLAIAESFAQERIVTESPIDFVASTGEEGLGDLHGIKYFFSEHSEASAMIALDGPGDSRIVNVALGCFRMRLIFVGPGGHSWSAFGAPNAAHAVGITAAKIADIMMPAAPRSSASVTRIGGGTSINSIPHRAWLEVDLRSTTERGLRFLADEVVTAAYAAERMVNETRNQNTDPLELDIEIIGRRPCGRVADEHPLARAAASATELIGRQPEFVVASTDANVPLSLGIPAITIGAGGSGGGAHTEGEWFDNVDGSLGVVRAATIVLCAAGMPGV